MSNQTEIVEVEPMAIVKSDRVQLGTIELEPEEVIARGAKIAKALAQVIKKQSLFVSIRGRDHVRVEGWTTLGAMVGIGPRTVSVTEIEPGIFEARVELIRMSDGMIIGGGIAECGSPDETNRDGLSVWADRPRYARKSMAITRATGKAFRLSLSWIMQLAGFDPTPAEEIPHEEASPTIPKKDPLVREDWTSMFWQLANQYELDKEQAAEVLRNHDNNFHHAYETLKASLEPEPPQ